MSTTIRQTILIRASPARIFQALTTREDIAAWWGQIHLEPPGDPNLWPGRNREWPIRVRHATANRSLHLILQQHHPMDDSRFVPSLVRFEIAPRDGFTLVNVLQFGIPDEDWAGLLRSGWAWTLYYLQSWVESGRSLERLSVSGDFAIIHRSMDIHAGAEWCWQTLTDARLLSQWLGADATSRPEPGGRIDIRWPCGRHVGGEYVLLDAPRTLISHGWDAASLATHDDPGLITITHWSITGIAPGKSRITLTDTGYERSRISRECIAEADRGWARRLDSLVEFALEQHPPRRFR